MNNNNNRAVQQQLDSAFDPDRPTIGFSKAAHRTPTNPQTQIQRVIDHNHTDCSSAEAGESAQHGRGRNGQRQNEQRMPRYQSERRPISEQNPLGVVVKDGMELDAGQFSRKHFNCISAAQAVSGPFKGFRVAARFLFSNNEIAKYGCDLRGGFSSFAVYARGLTENVIIGNAMSSLLRVVTVTGAAPGEYTEKIYDSPIYAQVLPREINEIEIELRTMDNGRLVPFAYGTVMVVLIFKKVINF